MYVYFGMPMKIQQCNSHFLGNQIRPITNQALSTCRLKHISLFVEMFSQYKSFMACIRVGSKIKGWKIYKINIALVFGRNKEKEIELWKYYSQWK